MAFPRVIPHSDAAGVVDAVGESVDATRVGQRVWVYGAQSYRAFGTATQCTVVPDHLAVALSDHLSDETGSRPGHSRHHRTPGRVRDGSVDGRTVLVQGVLGGVGSLAAQLARWGGATVIGTVTRGKDLDRVDRSVVSHAVALEQDDPANAIRAYALQGVHRVVEVALSDNADLDAEVVAGDVVIAAYATRADRPQVPFWPLVVRQRHPAPDRQRRLPRSEATGRARSHRRRRQRLSIDIGARYPLVESARVP
jgi:NADPH2:quinone reductase